MKFLDTTIDSTISLKLALDIGRGMAFLHGITSSFRPQFILNSHHIMVNIETDVSFYESFSFYRTGANLLHPFYW
jgi:hypothetical protein